MSSEISLAVIQRHVAMGFGLAPRELTSERRSKTVVEARHLAMWLATEMTGYSLARIGRAFGGRDHTTVMHGLAKAEILLQRQPNLPARMLKIRAEIEAEAIAGDQEEEAALLTESLIIALRVSLLELARRNPVLAIATILPLAERLAEGGVSS